MKRVPDYGHQAIVGALQAVGVRVGDVLFTHSSIATLGVSEGGLDAEAIATMFLSAVREVAGPGATWLLPAFTYSYVKDEVFDPLTVAPSREMGLLPSVLWRHPDALRTLDPIFSVIAIGARARELTSGVPTSCFDERSVFARLIELDGAVCNIGIGSFSTLMHHVEQKRGVAYRRPKWFEGVSILDGRPRRTRISYYARDLDHPEHDSCWTRLDRDGRADGSVAVAQLGRGELNLVRARRMEELIVAGLERDGDYLVVGSGAS
ncbi:MAG TPA: AAC(3) family N-acetyltransferase [Solirubrobacteraceae bacterium]|nr:AAC(3) family N-acetyltransferase [Solirubrobacteraceae bacterium]